MSNSIVRATCPSCGDVVLTTGDLGLLHSDGHALFCFACPRCRQSVRHEVPEGIVHILHAAGVHDIEPPSDRIDDGELAEFLADFDRVDCLEQLRRLGHDA
jgi:predicted RNA-binding Zn-ribbon protein involved in translation (DUF1610 family)